MAQLAAIETAQRSLEESFARRMDELEAQLHSGAPGKETVAKVSEEFRSFRELMFNMLSLLRKQITECALSIDQIETRHRRKALIFLGVTESEREDCASTTLGLINSTMALKNFTPSDIRDCHRLGSPSKDHHRPILVWFARHDCKSAVWKAKSTLKGTSVSVREFLTKARQPVFTKARLHFGLRKCWTQDGNIFVTTPDGRRHKIVGAHDLNPLVAQFPRVSAISTVATRNMQGTSTAGAGSMTTASKPRNN